MRKKISRKEAFETIYKESYWGAEVKSGAGSTLEATKVVREILIDVIQKYKISSLVDVACGDLTWMPLVLNELNNEINYIGCDIVESLIATHKKDYPEYAFQTLDIVEDNVPEAELILCREVLQHLPVKDIKRALSNFSKSQSKYLLATIHLKRFGFRNKRSIRPGRCRDRNLMMPPFNLPNPLVIYSEQYGDSDKFIGLWKLPLE